LDFSFSGLKTSILYFLRDQQAADPGFVEKNLADICASVQHRIITILLAKLEKAANELGIREIAIAGGVSANSGLRTSLTAAAQKKNWRIYIPRFEYCTDNAAMIAMAGYFKYAKGEFVGQDIAPLARMPIKA
jgi:N6-L-threonylcarbamoyladenine synthase